jgi:hypothetical protein
VLQGTRSIEVTAESRYMHIIFTNVIAFQCLDEHFWHGFRSASEIIEKTASENAKNRHRFYKFRRTHYWDYVQSGWVEWAFGEMAGYSTYGIVGQDEIVYVVCQDEPIIEMV